MTHPTRGFRWRHGTIAVGSGLAVLLGAGIGSAPGGSASTVPPGGSSSGSPAGATRVVSAKEPIISDHPAEQSALRPATSVLAPERTTRAAPAVNNWSTIATLPGAVIHDVVFPTSSIGYAAGELGQVWKTTDGGQTWTEILNRGFPYYFYGVAALSANHIAISGFNDSNFTAIVEQSSDGGKTWTPNTILSTTAWADRIRFAGAAHALVMNGLNASLTSPNLAWYTNGNGRWLQDTPDPAGGWFGSQFDLHSDLHAYASGITYCQSGNAGAGWNCRPSVDPVFDGAVQFANQRDGWVAGGEILPDVAGWVHRTTDGGATWSDRVLSTPWPVRQLDFLNGQAGWATGGNVYSGVGGMYYTSDGGKTWALDDDTGTEVGSCANHSGGGGLTSVWCIGFTYGAGGFSSSVYKTTVHG